MTPIPTSSEGTLVGTLTWMRHTLSSFGAESCSWLWGFLFSYGTSSDGVDFGWLGVHIFFHYRV